MLLDDVHKETIRENLVYMVENFNPTNTHFLDDLVGEDCLSSDEAASVRNQSRRKDKVRKLMCIVATKDCEKFKQFLSLLEKQNDNNFIATQLKSDFEERLRNTKLEKKCIKCTIKQSVNLKDVVDKLCKHQLIDLKFVNLVVSRDMPHDQGELWDALFQRLDSSDERRHYIKIFQEALADKYEQIAASFNKVFSRTFQCQCNTIVLTLKVPSSQGISSGSTGDISTTETRRGANIENASHIVASDDIMSSISGANSSDPPTNIPNTITAKWIVNAPFHIDSEYPVLETPTPTTATSLQTSPTGKSETQKHADKSNLGCVSSGAVSQPQLCNLQNIAREHILKLPSTMTRKKDGVKEQKKITYAVKISNDSISGDCTSLMEQTDEMGLSTDLSKLSADNQRLNERPMCAEGQQTNESDFTSYNAPNIEYESRHKKKKKRKSRKRSNSESDNSKQISNIDNQKPRAASVDTSYNKTQVAEKTECLLKFLTYDSLKDDHGLPKEKYAHGSTDMEINFDENKKPFPNNKDVVYAHEQPIITPSKKIDHLNAGMPALQQGNSSSRTKNKKSDRKSSRHEM